MFLPYKGETWVEGKAFNWPNDQDKIERHIQQHGRTKDLYYCPNMFSEPRRNADCIQALRWLYADLDNVEPKKVGITPTIAVQSSPGRYQALWKLSRRLSPDRHETYNRRLTYATGADRGGWDLTQVLRIPGTRNHKYPGRIKVRSQWVRPELTFSLAQVKGYLDGVESNWQDVQAIETGDLLLPAESAEELLEQYRPRFDTRLLSLIESTDIAEVQGEEGRSGVLWELECRLLEAGLKPEEVFVVVKESIWNKFRDRRDGDLVLWREVQKAHLHVGSVVTDFVASTDHSLTRSRPRLLTYAEILGSAIREPEWGIDGWWTLGSHGVVAGLPKSFKSLVTLDMAVSYASETPFMGQYEVNPRAAGPVLIIQQENSFPLVKDRLLKVSSSRGLQVGKAVVEDENTVIFQAPPSIPLIFYNDFGFDMTNAEDQEAVEIVIRKEGVKTVIFDPLYLMIGGADENLAKEMRPILTWLLRIRNLYNCAVVVVHHWGKGSQTRGGRGVGGQRLLGSTTIYGWLEAALYLEAHHSEYGVQVVVEREFRERPSAPPLAFNLTLGDIGEMEYAWDSAGAVGTTNKLIETIDKAGPRGASLAFIRNEMDWGQKKTRKELDDLIELNLIEEKVVGKAKRIFLTGKEDGTI